MYFIYEFEIKNYRNHAKGIFDKTYKLLCTINK